MSFKILAINPGSTSTKVALFEDERPLLDLTLRHTAEEIAAYANITDQLPWRREIILKALAEQGFDIRELSAVIGRGGLIKPIPAGVYEVNDAMRHDLIHAQMEHASNLGGLIADEIARMAGVKAYIADPVVVDEMEDVARISGLPECPRRSIFHALNQKATARLHCEKTGLRYEDSNLIVAHMGGGISVSAHCRGRVIDTNNALNGDGPLAPERAGTLPAEGLVEICFSGKYTKKEVMKKLAGKGGMVAHLGLNSVQQLCINADRGDEKCRAMIEATGIQYRQGDRRHGHRPERQGRRHRPHGRRCLQRAGERGDPRTRFVHRPDLYLPGRKRAGVAESECAGRAARRHHTPRLRIRRTTVYERRRGCPRLVGQPFFIRPAIRRFSRTDNSQRVEKTCRTTPSLLHGMTWRNGGKLRQPRARATKYGTMI